MIRAVTNPSPTELDALEASRQRLAVQSPPGTYVVLEGPPLAPDPAWHRRQAELYRDAVPRQVDAMAAGTRLELPPLRLDASAADVFRRAQEAAQGARRAIDAPSTR